jgi:hypothetical protein
LEAAGRWPGGDVAEVMHKNASNGEGVGFNLNKKIF